MGDRGYFTPKSVEFFQPTYNLVVGPDILQDHFNMFKRLAGSRYEEKIFTSRWDSRFQQIHTKQKMILETPLASAQPPFARHLVGKMTVFYYLLITKHQPDQNVGNAWCYSCVHSII